MTIVGVAVLASVANAQVFYCPNDVDSYITVALVDATDGETPETEKKSTDTTITVTDITDGNTPASYDDTGAWVEIGDGTGDYKLTIGASEFDEPDSVYFVKIVVAGCRTVRFRVMTPETVANRFNDILGATGDGSSIKLDSSGNVYISSGTGAGQLSITSGVVDVNTTDVQTGAAAAITAADIPETVWEDPNAPDMNDVGGVRVVIAEALSADTDFLDLFIGSGALTTAVAAAILDDPNYPLGTYNGGLVKLHADYDAAKTASQAGDQMDLVDTPNATAVADIQSGLSTLDSNDIVTAVIYASVGTVLSSTVETVTGSTRFSLASGWEVAGAYYGNMATVTDATTGSKAVRLVIGYSADRTVTLDKALPFVPEIGDTVVLSGYVSRSTGFGR